MAGFRGLLYTLAKLMGDYNAVKKGKVGKRVGRRVAGKAPGKAMRKLFKKPGPPQHGSPSRVHKPRSTPPSCHFGTSVRAVSLPHNQMLQSSGRNWLLLDYCSENLIVKKI